MTNTTTTIGSKMKLLRENANLTKKQLADYLSIDVDRMSKIEEGKCPIDTSLLNEIALLFCCPVTSLLSEDIPTDAISLDASDMNLDDLATMSTIHKIVLNQMWMDKLTRKTKQFN